MLREFAQRLMTLDRNRQSEGSQPSAIFGDVGQLSRYLDLDRPELRIAVYPILNSSAPTPAMGVAALLAALLDSWKDVRVYRLFVKLPATPSAFDWTIETSQFAVDDWQLDDLDHNVTLWGRLDQEGVVGTSKSRLKAISTKRTVLIFGNSNTQWSHLLNFSNECRALQWTLPKH
jgi:hypothetical protein